MTNLTSYQAIQEAVERRVQARSNEVVLKVFQHLCNKHNDLKCPCSSCEMLRRYVTVKLKAHRLKRRIENDQPIYGYPSEEDVYYGSAKFNDSYLMLKWTARWLKTKRFDTKQLPMDLLLST